MFRFRSDYTLNLIRFCFDLDKLYANTVRFASIVNLFKNETSFLLRSRQDEGKHCSFCFASEAMRVIPEAVRKIVEAARLF